MLILGLVFLLKDRKVAISKGRRTTHFVLRDADEHEDFGFGTCSPRWPLHQRKEDNGQGARSIKRTSAVPGNCFVSDKVRHWCKWPKPSECPKKTDVGIHAISICLPKNNNLKESQDTQCVSWESSRWNANALQHQFKRFLWILAKAWKSSVFLRPTNQVGRNTLSF